MDFSTLTQTLIEALSSNALQLVITLIVFIAYIAFDRFSSPKLRRGADQTQLEAGAGARAIRAARVLLGLFGALLLLIVWGIDLSAMLIVASTTLTLLGVALFASWSLLSNITAFFVLLLQPSFARGNFIRVIDADNYIEGNISDLSLLHTKLTTEAGELVVYPNNLLLGRPTIINPKSRLEGFGKLTNALAQTPEPPTR